MRKKEEDTSLRISRRKYEEKNKEKRRAENAGFQTMIPRKEYDIINKFLQEKKITKVELIYAGFRALKTEYEKNKNDK